jgi:hypothetical protein
MKDAEKNARVAIKTLQAQVKRASTRADVNSVLKRIDGLTKQARQIASGTGTGSGARAAATRRRAATRTKKAATTTKRRATTSRRTAPRASSSGATPAKRTTAPRRRAAPRRTRAAESAPAAMPEMDTPTEPETGMLGSGSFTDR